MAKITTGLRALRTWLKADPSRSQAWLARTLGVSSPSVSAWMAGTARPTSELRSALCSLAAIPIVDWETAAEKKRREALALRVAAGSEVAPRI